MARENVITYALIAVCLIINVNTGAASSATVEGSPSVTLPAPSNAVLTGITIRYDEPDFMRVNKTLDAYLGVPFAQPPVGDLRFADPLPLEIQGHLDATEDRAECPQASFLGKKPNPVLPEPPRNIAEDCLFLSIYTPSPKPATPTPVMVWFHGGAFSIGAGSEIIYEPIPLVAYADIIVVNVNYRLGVFGALTTGDDVATGNFGMMDQLLALQWVQQNIAAFGGDPAQVTIAGESAGGVSVGHHMLSPLTDGLFHQGIMQSGTSVCPWGYKTTESAAVHYRAFADVLDCPTEESQAMVDCLREVDEDLIIRRQALYINGSLQAPVIDGHFLPDSPVEMLKRKQVKNVPTLMGSNHDEMSIVALGLYPGSRYEPPVMNMSAFKTWLPRILKTVETAEEIAAVEQHYIDWTVADNVTGDQLDGFIRALTDEEFACPTEYYARQLEAAGANVYRYEMVHQPAFSIYVGLPEWTGAAHAEDLQYLFAWGLNPTLGRFVAQTDDEKMMSLEYIRYWTNFVKSGNPNHPVTSATYPDWPIYTMPEQEYKILSLNMTNGRAMRAADCSLWINYLPDLRAQTAPMEEVYEDWQEQYELWRDVDMPSWQTSFDSYKEDSPCPVP